MREMSTRNPEFRTMFPNSGVVEVNLKISELTAHRAMYLSKEKSCRSGLSP